MASVEHIGSTEAITSQGFLIYPKSDKSTPFLMWSRKATCTAKEWQAVEQVNQKALEDMSVT